MAPLRSLTSTLRDGLTEVLTPVFGAPSRRENHADRALEAAGAIEQSLRSPDGLEIGIA